MVNLKGHQNIFKHQLSKSSEAIKYLRSRNVSFKSVSQFHLGWCKIPPKFFGNFSSCIMIPLINHYNETTSFFGRRVTNIRPKYEILSGSTKGDTIFSLDLAKFSIIDKGFAIITEGIFDVIMAHQFEFTNTVAAPGKSWSFQQVALLRRFTDSVFLIFDNDSTGKRATEKYRRVFYEAGFFVSSMSLPKEIKDLDEYLRCGNYKKVRAQISRRG